MSMDRLAKAGSERLKVGRGGDGRFGGFAPGVGFDVLAVCVCVCGLFCSVVIAHYGLVQDSHHQQHFAMFWQKVLWNMLFVV